MASVKFLILFFLLFNFVFAKTDNAKIGVYEKQNQIIALGTNFKNEYNKEVSINEAIESKATILNFNYFSCPGLCSPLLNGIVDVVNKMDLKPFVDYKILSVSIEPNDTPKEALSKKEKLINQIKKPFPPQTWNFLTTTNENSIKELTQSAGFFYEKRVKDGITDYLHPGLLIIVSPNGKIIRYINGTDFLPFDLKLAIIEAQDEKSRPTIAKTLLYCFAYDAENKTYVFQAEKVIGTIMILIILGFFIYLIKTSKKHRKDDSYESDK